MKRVTRTHIPTKLGISILIFAFSFFLSLPIISQENQQMIVKIYAATKPSTLFSAQQLQQLSESPSSGAIINAVTPTPVKIGNPWGQCLDDRKDGKTANTVVQEVTCSGSSGQTWYVGYGDGTIRINNLCLGTYQNHIEVSQPLVLKSCDVSSIHWHWGTFSSYPTSYPAVWNYTYFNKNIPMCIQAPGVNEDPNGTQLIIGGCSDTNNSIWSVLTL